MSPLLLRLLSPSKPPNNDEVARSPSSISNPSKNNRASPPSSTYSKKYFCLCSIAITAILYTLLISHQSLLLSPSSSSRISPFLPSSSIPITNSTHHDSPFVQCHSSTPKVQPHSPSVPSYLSYHRHPINVSYTPRSILLNNTPSFFLSGSIHPSRNTPQTFSAALDEAVHHRLNMVTIDTFWNEFQPFSTSPLDFHFGVDDDDDQKSSRWSLADAIRMAGCRGLFVHLRIGPYICGEETYGGIPSWIPLLNSSQTTGSMMRMRRYDEAWMDVMSLYVAAVTDYVREEGLWGYMGGPVILAQIENELAGVDGGDIMDYANWCGDMAVSLEPEVVWTMSYGFTSPKTIETCDQQSCREWIEHHGISQTIQITHPALYTEMELGFQIWGDDSSNPSHYFWGRTARDISRDILRWLARGGSHVNYYMFQGGYNRGRLAGSGIMNAYSTDAILCPDGSRHEPKYSHLRRLHDVLVEVVANILMGQTSRLGMNESVEVMDKKGIWVTSGKSQRLFDYGEVIFVENDDDANVTIRIPKGSIVVDMHPKSSMILVNGSLHYDSAHLREEDLSYSRQVDVIEPSLEWISWREPINYDPSLKMLFLNDTAPMEQTRLLFHFNQSSDFAWFETNVTIPHDTSIHKSELLVQTQKGNALVLFIDGVFVNATDNHEQEEGDVTLSLFIGDMSPGTHRMTLLSESLGYFNLIGFMASEEAKSKGITGRVTLRGTRNDGSVAVWELVKNSDNNNKNDDDDDDNCQWWWLSRLAFIGNQFPNERHRITKNKIMNHEEISMTLSDDNVIIPPSTWSVSYFQTPMYDPNKKSLMVDIPSLGRGVVYVNGHSLGRYWNITRGSSTIHSQRYYMIPFELLTMEEEENNSSWNKLLLFNVLGGDLSMVKIVLTWIEKDDNARVEDEIDTSLLCLV